MNANTLPKLKAELERIRFKADMDGTQGDRTVQIGVKVRDLTKLIDEIDAALVSKSKR